MIFWSICAFIWFRNMKKMLLQMTSVSLQPVPSLLSRAKNSGSQCHFKIWLHCHKLKNVPCLIDYAHVTKVPKKLINRCELCNVIQHDDIICFKIKNPPTVHSTSKIQPTTSPTFVLSVPASVRKSGVMKENCWTVVLVVVHRVFYSHFIISLKKYDMVAKTFLYIIIILCFVNKLNSSVSNFGGRLSQPKKLNFF
jgi:hypothetical protein